MALVHGTSRADKQWPADHWIELGLRLNEAGFEVLLPHGSVSEYSDAHGIARPLNQLDEATPGARVLPVLSLDALTRELAACAGVIGVDSGISHIAVALGLPHVQIYNFDTAWRTGPLEAAPQRQFSVFAHPFPEVDAVWQAWLACGVQADRESGMDSDIDLCIDANQVGDFSAAASDGSHAAGPISATAAALSLTKQTRQASPEFSDTQPTAP